MSLTKVGVSSRIKNHAYMCEKCGETEFIEKQAREVLCKNKIIIEHV